MEYALLPLLPLVSWLVLLGALWIGYLEVHPGKGLRFSITDLWAAMLGLLPTCCVLTAQLTSEASGRLVGLALGVGVAQILGALCGRLVCLWRLPRESRLRSFGCVLSGTLCGILPALAAWRLASVCWGWSLAV